MSNQIHYLMHDADGNVFGSGSSPDGTLPEGATICTAEQAAAPKDFVIQAGEVVAAPAAVFVGRAKEAKIASLYGDYLVATQQDLAFTTSAGQAQIFQADSAARANAEAVLAAYGASGDVPEGFYWVASDNSRVPFSLGDLRGLAKAMGDQGWEAFQLLQNLKASVAGASTVAEVQALSWGSDLAG